MQAIYFKSENQKCQWNEFIAENCSESFLQSWEWGNFQESLGRKIWRIGIIDNNLHGEEETNKLQITNYKLQTNSKSQTNPNYQIPNPNYKFLSSAPLESPSRDSSEIANTDALSRRSPLMRDSDGALVAVALIVKYDLPFGKSYLYCPRGPAIKKFKVQSSKFKVLDFLFEEIKGIAKKEKSLFLRIDPPASWNLELGTWNLELSAPLESPPRDSSEIANTDALSRRSPLMRDSDGALVDWNLEFGIWNLEDRGFRKSPSEIQPKNTLMLDLTKSERELLREMKQKTRYNIKLAERKKLRITNYELRITNREIFKKDFEEFWMLVEKTSKRDGFKSHSKDYYWKMLENLSVDRGLVKNCHSELVSESVDDKGLPCLQFAKQSIGMVGGTSGYRKKIPELNSRQALKQSLSQTCFGIQDDKCNCKNKLQAKLYLAEYNNKIIAANIVLYFGDLAVYLHGASSSEYRNTMAPHLLQWRQILDAKKAGCKAYDFWGISSLKSQIPNPKSQTNPNLQITNYQLPITNYQFNNWSGITRFKKGFGGFEKNYIGAYDLAFDNIGYAIYKSIKFVKLKVHKVIRQIVIGERFI